MKINYNDMLKMLWNLEENVVVFSNFSLWDENENNLIKKAKEFNKKVLLVNKELNNLTYIIPTSGMEAKANQQDCTLVIWYAFNFEYDYKNLKNNLNSEKAVILSNNPDINKIKKSFGEDHVFIIENDESLNKTIKKSEDALRAGQFETYKKINGFNYSFSGFVSQGNQLGRTIGYPTANVVVDNHLIIKPGVYVTKVKLPNIEKQFQGISAYWTNKNGVSVFETHILDFNQDIYGWGIEIEIEAYIRASIQIRDFNHLKELLNSDKEFAIKYFKGV